MNGCLIVLRSVTYAQRAKRTLEKMGINSHVVKPAPELVGNGCGFAIKVSEIYLAEALDALRKQKFEIVHVYVPTDSGMREMKM